MKCKERAPDARDPRRADTGTPPHAPSRQAANARTIKKIAARGSGEAAGGALESVKATAVRFTKLAGRRALPKNRTVERARRQALPAALSVMQTAGS